MARIRTVKPALFKHEALFDAEQKTKLPLRFAFIGLLTCCDREGRFHWKPRRLKLDILPYDAIDLSDVLGALAEYGFIIPYEKEGECYGYIPSWQQHQRINHRELDSEIPAPKNTLLAQNLKEKGEVDKKTDNPPKKPMDKNKKTDFPKKQFSEELPNMKFIFEHWKKVMQHPNAKLDKKRQDIIYQALLAGYNTTQLCNAITGCSLTPHNIGKNDHGERYDGLHIILRDADQIDRFIHNYHNPPQPTTKSNRHTQNNTQTITRWMQKQMDKENNHVNS